MRRRHTKSITWTQKYCGKGINPNRGMSSRAKRQGNHRLRQALKRDTEEQMQTLSPVNDRHRKTRFEAWKEFHRNNPTVFDLFYRFAREAKASNRTSLGARLIGERIRWYTTIEIQSSDDFKLNDHYWPYYSRLLMGLHPSEFAGFFERRDARFDASDSEILDFHTSLTPALATAA